MPGSPAPLQALDRTTAAGLVLSLVGILFGFGLGGVFGLAESSLKGSLEASGTAALESAYKGDVAAKDAVVKKSWDYLKRAHLHGGAIGAAGVAIITALVMFGGSGILVGGASIMLGLGSLLYGLFWLSAGFAAPGLGSTGAAKEAYSFLGVPGAGLPLVGLLLAIVAIVRAQARR
jgi:hypothetical protein